jgi:hypothetical protein
MDHALPAPARQVEVFGACADFSVSAFGGSGSHFQRSLPVRASKARTSPLDMSTRALSSIAEPTITTSSITAGGDVM